MPSSRSLEGVTRASRFDSGILAVEIAAWFRFRADAERSSAMKPDGVRTMDCDSAAARSARVRSRRALAFSRLSSWKG